MQDRIYAVAAGNKLGERTEAVAPASHHVAYLEWLLGDGKQDCTLKALIRANKTNMGV